MADVRWLTAALEALGFTAHPAYADGLGVMITDMTRGEERVCIAHNAGQIVQVLISNARVAIAADIRSDERGDPILPTPAPAATGSSEGGK